MIAGELSQYGFRFLDNRSKRRLFIYSQIGQYFTVDFNGGFFQTSNQTAVGKAIDTSASIDTSDPKCPELTLTLPAVTVGVLACFDYRLLGNTENTRTRPIVAFCEFQDFFVTSTSDNATLNTSHELFL